MGSAAPPGGQGGGYFKEGSPRWQGRRCRARGGRGARRLLLLLLQWGRQRGLCARGAGSCACSVGCAAEEEEEKEEEEEAPWVEAARALGAGKRACRAALEAAGASSTPLRRACA